MHHFTISVCESVSQLNDNLVTQFNEGMGYKRITIIKNVSLKIQKATSRSVAVTQKKGKQYIRHIIYTNQGHLPTKVTPDIDFTDEPVIGCDIPVVENTFVDDCK